jgi:hypothetical protein
MFKEIIAVYNESFTRHVTTKYSVSQSIEIAATYIYHKALKG